MLMRYTFFIGLILLSIYFAFRTTKKYHFLAATLTALGLYSALSVSMAPMLTVDILSLRLRLVSARSFIIIISLVYFVSCLSRKNLERLLTAFGFIAALNAISVLIYEFGMSGSRSMDMTICAMILPSILLRKESLKWYEMLNGFIVLTAMFITKGSTVFFMLIGIVACYLAFYKKWKEIVIAVLAIVTVGVIINKGEFLYHIDRTEQWALLMSWWNNHAEVFFGTGLGTFQWLGPEIQNKSKDLFVWMHNEYLQIIFEMGYVGFGLTIALSIVCLKRSLNRPWLFSTCVAILISFVTQFPLRVFLSEIFILLIIRLCLEDDEVETYETAKIT